MKREKKTTSFENLTQENEIIENTQQEENITTQTKLHKNLKKLNRIQ